MQEQEKNKFLGQEKISKLLLKFSTPCILSLLVSALYNIVDQIFIGNSELGYLGNAATGVVFPILIIAQAFAWCIGDGCAAFMSICQGRRDTSQAHKSIGSGITLTLCISIVLMVVFALFREPLLRLFGTSDNTIGMAVEYFTIVLAFFPVFMLMNMMNSVIRADGSPAFSMVSMSAGAVLNIILDPIFIYLFKWGIAGAAWATVIGQTVSFLICFAYFFRTKTFRLKLKSFLPDFGIILNTLKLGASSFITQMSIVAISLTCNIMLCKYGALSVYGQDIPISVISIETKVFTIVINIIVGIVLGGQPVLGYNVGAKKYDRVRTTYRIILFATAAVGLVSTLIFELCPQLVVGIFGSGNALYNEFAMRTFRIFLSLVTFTCIIKMSSIFFQAVGKPVRAVASSLIRDIVCFIPLVIILPAVFEAAQPGTGINGILFAAPAADFIAMIIAACLTVNYFRRLGGSSAESVSAAAAPATQVVWPTRKGVIVTIARQHGSCGKRVGQLLAQQLGIPCYYKELTALAAQESGLDSEFISDINRNSPTLMHELYLSTDAVRQAIEAQSLIIRKIADCGSCVLVGRAADGVLSDYPGVVRVFIRAPREYRLGKISEMYGDSPAQALKSLERADAARAGYYRTVTGCEWGEAENYELCIDSSAGPEKTAQVIASYALAREQA